MAEENKQEEIKTNVDNTSKKPSATKKVIYGILLLDAIAIPIFFLVQALNYQHERRYGRQEYTTKQTTSYDMVAGYEARHFANSMLHHANHEMEKQYGITMDPCGELVCVTYNEKSYKVYDYSIVAYADRKDSDDRLYTITIQDIELTYSNDIQFYMLDLTEEALDTYAYTISYTTIVSKGVRPDSYSYFYISRGPDQKQLVSGVQFHNDGAYYVFREHECDSYMDMYSEQAEQIFREDSQIKNYYKWFIESRGE